MKGLSWSFLIPVLFLGGCMKEIGTSVLSEAVVGGKIAVTWSTESGDEIDFGQINNTARFPLIVSNNGDRSVVDIHLTNSNPQFVSDQSIDTLLPGNTLASVRIISLVVVHGTSASGIGLAQTLNPGLNMDTLILTGTTEDAVGRKTAVQSEFLLQVTALLADIRLFDDTTEVDLTHPTGVETGFGIGINEILGYEVVHPMARVVNSGNVPIYLTEYQGATVLPERTIQPNGVDSVGHFSNVAIDTRGVVTIGNRLRISSDGKCYFFLSP